MTALTPANTPTAQELAFIGGARRKSCRPPTLKPATVALVMAGATHGILWISLKSASLMDLAAVRKSSLGISTDGVVGWLVG